MSLPREMSNDATGWWIWITTLLMTGVGVTSGGLVHELGTNPAVSIGSGVLAGAVASGLSYLKYHAYARS